MTVSISLLNIAWFARRCSMLYPETRRLSQRQIDRLQHEVGSLTGAGGAPHISLRPALESLVRAMGLSIGEWIDQPSREALPMLAYVPGVGACLLVARTPGGGWLIDSPKGAQELNYFPEGGAYAAVCCPSGLMPSDAGAFAVFKAALLTRKDAFSLAALASLLANTLALAASLYSMQVYDRVIPSQGVSTLIVLTVGVLIALVLEFGVKLLRSEALERSIKSIDLELSQKIFQRLLNVRMDQFPASVGTLSAQLRSYETIRGFASAATLYVAVDAPFAIFFLLVIILLAGVQVALVPLMFFAAALAIGLMYRRHIAMHAETSSAATNRKLGLLVETVEGAEVIKAAGASWQKSCQWDVLSRLSIEDDTRIRRYQEQASYIAAFMQQASYVLLIATGAWIASTSTSLTMGGLIACSILSGRVLAPVAVIPGLIVQWAHARAALGNLERVFALQLDNHEVSQPLFPERIYGEFQLSDLKFVYPGRPNTLSIDSLKILPGEKLAILGHVGAGKSTLLKILAGLYKPQEGRLMLDGLDLHQIARCHLSERIGYCPQDVKLFAGTLRDNLLAGLSGIDDGKILDVAKVTGLSALIASHPKGLDLDIYEGGRGVSGGQAQLITLTRLLLGTPDIWLLDEPTASMDEQFERASVGALTQAIKPEHTMVLVTHKPALLGLVNRIVILSPGGVVMDGPRDAVLSQLQSGAGHAPARPPSNERRTVGEALVETV